MLQESVLSVVLIWLVYYWLHLGMNEPRSAARTKDRG